jgi:predicted nucleic acid-binding protein
VLATALSAGAEFLVTGDKELRQLGAYGGTRLLLPREFLTELDRQVAG